MDAECGSQTKIWATSDVLWDFVESIEPEGEDETFDLRVGATHTFVADDLIVHNSGAIEEDAAGVLLVYPDKEDAARAAADGTFPRGPVKTWCKLDLNRFGEQQIYIPMWHFKSYTRFELVEAE